MCRGIKCCVQGGIQPSTPHRCSFMPHEVLIFYLLVLSFVFCSICDIPPWCGGAGIYDWLNQETPHVHANCLFLATKRLGPRVGLSRCSFRPLQQSTDRIYYVGVVGDLENLGKGGGGHFNCVSIALVRCLDRFGDNYFWGFWSNYPDLPSLLRLRGPLVHTTYECVASWERCQGSSTRAMAHFLMETLFSRRPTILVGVLA